MTTSRGPTIALWLAAAAVAVLVAAGFAFRGRIQEEYWLWRLWKGTEEDELTAMRNLEDIGSEKALLAIMEIMVQRSPTAILRRSSFDGFSGGFGSMHLHGPLTSIRPHSDGGPSLSGYRHAWNSPVHGARAVVGKIRKRLGRPRVMQLYLKVIEKVTVHPFWGRC